MTFTSLPAPVDVLVLGATVAGLVAAIELAKTGAEVQVLDPGPVTRTGLGLDTVLEQRLVDIESRHGASVLRDYVDQCELGREYLAGLATTSDLGRTQLPTYGVVTAAEGLQEFERLSETLARAEIDAAPAETSVLPGGQLAAALSVTGQGVLDTSLHREALLAAARAAGVTITRPVTLTRFIPGSPWTVRLSSETGEQEILALQVIDTIGVSPWGWNAFASLRYAPIVIADVPNPIKALYVLVDTPVAVLRPERNRLLAIGKPVGSERETTAAAEVIRWLREHLDANPVQLRVQPVERPFDVLPLVGAIPLLSGAWVARGFGLWETTAATAAGIQIAAGIDRGERMPWTPARLPASPVPAFERLSRRVAGE